MIKNVNAIDTSNLVNKTSCNAKIKDIEDKIPSITNLSLTSALTVIEKKILSVSNLVKKAGCAEKIKEFESKYFTKSDLRNLRIIYLKQKWGIS